MRVRRASLFGIFSARRCRSCRGPFDKEMYSDANCQLLIRDNHTCGMAPRSAAYSGFDFDVVSGLRRATLAD